MGLPRTVQEIADVIGRERALYLVGQLPRCHPASRRAEAVVVYVPTLKRLKPDHMLVKILGWNDAAKICHAFGGEVLQPGNCRDLYRKFRDESVLRMRLQGVPVSVIADWMGITQQHVRGLLTKNLQVETAQAANDNTPHPENGARVADGTTKRRLVAGKDRQRVGGGRDIVLG